MNISQLKLRSAKFDDDDDDNNNNNNNNNDNNNNNNNEAPYFPYYKYEPQVAWKMTTTDSTGIAAINAQYSYCSFHSARRNTADTTNKEAPVT